MPLLSEKASYLDSLFLCLDFVRFLFLVFAYTGHSSSSWEDFYILTYHIMRNTLEAHHREDIPSISHTKKSQNNYDIKLVEERLFYVKVQEIIDELIQITTFVKELGKLWFENSELLNQINTILSRLRSGDRNYKYTKIVHVLTKYLGGVRDFAATTNIKGVIFYKKLFESTLVAIIQELDDLDEVR